MSSLSEFEKAALTYSRLGWRVFPLRPRDKLPHIKEWQIKATTSPVEIKRWWRKWQDANVAIATGRGSGIWALDVDPKNGGDASLDKLINEHGKLPNTVEALTGGGGRHFLFTMPEGITVNNTAGHLGPGLDTRGAGGYIAVAPSIHPSGRAYDWEASSEPGDVPVAPAPDWLIELLQTAKPTNGTNGEIPQPFSKGSRNNALASLAGSMRRKGLSVDAITQALLVTNEQQCQPPLRETEVRAIAESVGRYEPEDAVTGDESVQVAKQDTTNTVIPTPPTGREFMAKVFPARKRVLGPFTTSALVHAAGDAGVGKTMVAVAISNSLCAGTGLFSWQGYEPVKVLHVDGEMPGDMLQERIQLFEWGGGLDRLQLLSVHDYCTEHGLPSVNLADPVWQERVVYLAQGVDVVQLDNFFSLVSVPGVSLASDEHYAPIRPLLVTLRAMGKLVIFWDHTNADGKPFGTRTKGWLCDFVLTLTKDKDALSDEVVFTLAFTKTRGLGGRDYWPFNAKLLTDTNGKATWLVKLEEEAQMQQAWDLQKGGATQREISKELEISLGKVNKLLKKARQVGLP